MSMLRVAVVGTGDLASKTTQLLSMQRPEVQILLIGRNADRAERAANLARLAGRQMGLAPRVQARAVGSFRSGRFADTLREFNPTTVFLAVSELPWYRLELLPETWRERLYALGLGPWAPVHLAPVLEAMHGIASSGTATTVVNAGYPDAINPMLRRAKFVSGPILGVGHVANYVPGLTEAIAQELGAEYNDVKVRVVCHHAVTRRIGREGAIKDAPIDIRVAYRGNDVTPELDRAQLFKSLAAEKSRPSGRDGSWMTAASSARVLSMVLGGGAVDAHAPGVDGRIGGYPVRRVDGRVIPDLEGFVSEDLARELNERGQVWDGIERIDADGTLWLTERAVHGMKEMLRFDCEAVRVCEAAEISRELRARFEEFRIQGRPRSNALVPSHE